MAIQENVLDFNKICRLCLTEDSVMSSIYNDDGKHSSSVSLQLRIMACVSVELNSLDGLPSHICTTCLCQVDGWYKFKELCETADAFLKQCIKNEPVQVDTIAQIRNRAQEIRQFLSSPNLVKVDGLDTLDELNSTDKTLEISEARNSEDEVEMPTTVRSQNYLVYLNPDMYFKWLRREYKLNNELRMRELPNSKCDPTNPRPCYEIAFDSRIENFHEKESRNERIVMELGDCQLLALNPSNESEENCESSNDSVLFMGEEMEDHSYVLTVDEQECSDEMDSDLRNRNLGMDQVLANYEKTREYLDRVLNEKGNIHEEVIENVLYSFRLDDEGKLDVVNIVEGVTEPNLPRGFRYTCLFCSKIILNKLMYDKHIREVHLDRLVCNVCDKQLYSLRNFLIHTKTHLGVYTFTCPLCGKGLTRASIFKSHMMYHYYGKVQKCQICNKKFRDVFALRRHVQLHDKKIEFVCELCGFGTHLKSNLEYHMRAHADEKLFMCEICGKQFGAPQSLQHHMKTHEPNFPCPHCKRVYRHESKFINHLEQSHSDLIKYMDDAESDDEEKNDNQSETV
ncbi:hypothetical protein RUM43_011014 [Polyplax serrata]|uniref:Uncharacterized protein n=1 Tax=Polyplax serrata TaxID=468196 RepID=A0AAN8S3G4_POLSC